MLLLPCDVVWLAATYERGHQPSVELRGRSRHFRTSTVEEGKRADLIVIDGDPVADIAILQDRSKLEMVMKDGKVMVNQLGLPQELSPIPDYVMDIEHIQNAKAAPSTMPTAAEVQH